MLSFPASRPPTISPPVGSALRNSSSQPDTPVARSDLSPTVTAIVEELQRTFFGVLPAAAVAQCATKAVQDLLGSICLQALPEMAIRLATVRLEKTVAVEPEPAAAPATTVAAAVQ